MNIDDAAGIEPNNEESKSLHVDRSQTKSVNLKRYLNQI